jgi:dimethylamine/trimethylamine dehydrogenase
VLRESSLPGLTEWRRVVDWRLARLAKMPNVGLYPSSPMTAAEILETGIQHVILATGATYRRDGRGRTLHHVIPGTRPSTALRQAHGGGLGRLSNIFTPDDLMDGHLPTGRVILYDDDHFYLGGVLAELLIQHGCDVTLVTPAPLVSYWTQFTLEQSKIQARLMKLGVRLWPQTLLSAIQPAAVTLTHTLTGTDSALPCDAVVLVTDRLSNDGLYYELKPALADGRLRSLRLIGDAEAPNIIAQAVFSGHLVAREFDEEHVEGPPFKIERTYP